MTADKRLFDTSPANLGLRVKVHSDVDGQVTDLLFRDFPIRIGRDKLNDLVLNHPYVSQWHAVIGFSQGGLSVVQVGSSNSVRVKGHKLSTNSEVRLAGDETIDIVPFALEIEMVTTSGKSSAPDRPSPLLASATNAGKGDAAMGRVALEAMTQLAQRYLDAPLTTPREVALFAERLEQTLDVFLRCLVALRRGQEEFRAALDMSALTRDSRDSVERANSPEELARALFGPGSGAAVSLEGIFKDIMIHQVALLNGLMAGVRNLLSKLSPKAIQREVSKRHRSPAWRALWQTFERIHRDLSQEENATFEEIFGRQFDRAYSKVAGKGDREPE